MANIMLLSLVFRPDNVSTAHLLADLVKDLADAGHGVTVLTTTPHYNLDATALAEQPLHGVSGGLFARSRFHGVPVFHVWMPNKGTNKVYRVSTWLWFHIASTMLGMVIGKKPDVVLTPSPPLTIGLSGWFIAAIRQGRFIYNVQEIYPDVAVNLGIIKSSWLIGVLRRLEMFVYDRANVITVISRRMATNLREKGVPAGKIRVIPNFVDLSDFAPGERSNTFSREFGLNHKYVLSYAGNMGRPQHLDLLIEAAALLRDRTDIKVVMMGNGSECDRLCRKAAGLRNVVFIPQQSYSKMSLAYAAMDAGYVPQALGTSADGVPSKVYRILAAGRPVLAYTDADSDLADLIRTSRAGRVVTEPDPIALAREIAELADHRAESEAMGARGRGYVQEHFDRRVISHAYSTLIQEVAGGFGEL